jgi:membrane protein
VLALVGEYPRTYESIVDTLRDAAPGTAVDTINSALRDSLSDRGNAGALLGVGLLISLYSASGAIGAAMRSLESINRVKSGRSFLPNLGVRIGLTFLLMLLVLIAFLAVVVAGPLFGTIADAAGFHGFLKDAVGYARWPIGALSCSPRSRWSTRSAHGRGRGAARGRCARSSRARSSALCSGSWSPWCSRFTSPTLGRMTRPTGRWAP